MSRLVALFVIVALFAVAYAVPQPQLILSDGLGLASPIGLSSWGGLSPVGLSSWGSWGGVQSLGAGTILLKK
ncbi:unnamed protein product [Orchesella dallaii]|uniref:Uncharacterized protein n=1 Tax=Orchesella dallaii TaxID=48710 RepID=A0ABP1PMC0_9HEXA